ncbi:MAG: hypothetical protein F2694_08990 [Actinobacteria bacterium]|nr:hypothetical protein [Actinomycetota bacterium]MSY79771.1 hypothetical protein [Actinomycetota bacterium]MTA64690.1 hypothetical protein [Actinomycetota bacterium]
MSKRRWYNPNVPQTLGIAQMLLYLDAFWLVLAVLFGSQETEIGSGGLIGMLLGVGGIAAYVYGASGIANGEKRGYQVAVFASFLPLIRRVVLVVLAGASIAGNLSFIFLAGNVLNVMFEYALIGLLLHPMSRNHEKAYFS